MDAMQESWALDNALDIRTGSNKGLDDVDSCQNLSPVRIAVPFHMQGHLTKFLPGKNQWSAGESCGPYTRPFGMQVSFPLRCLDFNRLIRSHRVPVRMNRT